MSCGTQVGAKEWFLRSNKGIIALRQAEYQMPWPTDHKPMRTRWVTFHEQKWVRSRERRGHSVQTFPCTEQYRAMAFAQLTYRESLRDIEACLSAQPAKLWHMGFGGPVRRSTLADANEVRDWRIYAEFAQRLIAQAWVRGRWSAEP